MLWKPSCPLVTLFPDSVAAFTAQNFVPDLHR